MHHSKLAILVMFFLISQLFPYTRPDAVSFSGQWSFLAVPPLHDIVKDRSGSFDPPQYDPTVEEVIPEAARSDPNAAIPKQAEWKPIAVPAAWEQTAGIDFNGAGWYRKEITIPDNWLQGEQRVWIEFDAVATVAGVWLNGKWLGGHAGDYARWRLECGSAAQPGKNELLVYVDELPGHIFQGFLSVVAPHHGGIWQDVRIYRTGSAAVKPDGIHVQANPENGKITTTVALDGKRSESDPAPELIIRNLGKNSKVVMKTSKFAFRTETNSIVFELQISSPKIWSPETPSLYEAEIIFPAKIKNQPPETVKQKFAFRTVEINGSQVKLNGKRLNIRSVLSWGYYPRVVSPAPPPEVVRNEFAYIKSLGFNAETVCLIVMPDYFYDLADEMGILLWEEYPTWHNDFTAKDLLSYRDMYPAFFRRDRNHPSVILRTMSVEAGVKDQQVMSEIVNTAKEMTDTPIQDNSSWFWLSNKELTEWYGEDNYWNNDRWAKHMLIDLPSQLDQLPEKPYIIGESIAGTVWIDSEDLQKVQPGMPLLNGVTGTDQPHTGKMHPYWFPRCYDSSLVVEKTLRERYNPALPEGKDIIRDYLVPQSYMYALNFRKFQIGLLYADPRYAGWTLFQLRDVPNVHCGLIDDLGKRRWQPQDWKWLSENITPPATVTEIKTKDQNKPLVENAPQLQAWNADWNSEIERGAAVKYLKGGYSDVGSLFSSWPNASGIEEDEISSLKNSDILATSVLTDKCVDFMERGGVVLLITSKWPGALGGEINMYWADAVFVPPVDFWSDEERGRVLKLQMFDLTYDKSEAIPVGELGISQKVDPLLRLFETHGLSTVNTYDQLFATRVGKGLLVASSLDHTADAGQWVLGKLLTWAGSWTKSGDQTFPVTKMSDEEIRKFAVARTNAVIPLIENWRFKLDPDQQGEKEGWAAPSLDDSGWDTIQAAKMWESQGYSYDGMAWYRKWVNIPERKNNEHIYLTAEGVDDAYRVWVNGKAVAVHGSFTEHAKTVFVTKTETDLTDYLDFGKPNLIVMQVVDLFGGGGINRPIYLRIE